MSPFVLGRRVTDGVGRSLPTDLYYSAAWQVLEEDANSLTLAQYVWSPVYIDALIERDTSSGRLYAQHDAN